MSEENLTPVMIEEIHRIRSINKYIRPGIIVASFLIHGLLFMSMLSLIDLLVNLMLGMLAFAPFWYYIMSLTLDSGYIDPTITHFVYGNGSRNPGIYSLKIILILYPLTFGAIFTIYNPAYLLIYVAIFNLFTNFAAIMEIFDFIKKKERKINDVWVISPIFSVIGTFVILFDMIAAWWGNFSWFFILADIITWGKYLKRGGIFLQWTEAKNRARADPENKSDKILLILIIYVLVWPILAEVWSDYTVLSLTSYVEVALLENVYPWITFLFSVAGLGTGVLFIVGMKRLSGTQLPTVLQTIPMVKDLHKMQDEFAKYYTPVPYSFSEAELKSTRSAAGLIVVSLVIPFFPPELVIFYIIAVILLIPYGERTLRRKAHQEMDSFLAILRRWDEVEMELKTVGYPIEKECPRFSHEDLEARFQSKKGKDLARGRGPRPAA